MATQLTEAPNRRSITATRPLLGWRTVDILTIAFLGAALVVAALTAGCAYLPAPEGPAPMRYRDAIFSTVDETPDLVYGEAPDALGNPVTLKLDVFEPHGDDVTARPALVLVHGGGELPSYMSAAKGTSGS